MPASKSRVIEAGSTALRIFRVGELASYLKHLLEGDEALFDCWIAGEVSNVSQTGSGHFFFTVKERDAQMRCVLFRQQAIWQTVLPSNGTAVLAHGYVSMYEATGNLQFYVDTLQEEGQGALFLAFEQLKAALEAQGLFAEERKRPIPLMPRRIGLVTSPQAAALQDMLNVLGRRWPIAEVVLSPTQVQGDGAARQVAGAIAALNALEAEEAVDLIIVARGGGSIEELWAFNEEVVARAVFASTVPVISGVGHETDTTIIDYVADLRAPTPSAAAELATPDIFDLQATIDAWRRMMLNDMRGRIAVAWDEVESERDRLDHLSPMWQVSNDRKQIETMRKSMDTHLRHRLTLERERIVSAKQRLDALSPLQILKRGYAIVRDLDSGAVVSSIADAQADHLLEIRVGDGAFGARVVRNRAAESRELWDGDDEDYGEGN
ncbi:MAG TPA: exodeoxyribonuclease VII large subunit [Chloroflexia bacterium]|nr:exodeoxyribonuclease VII large subunit [Chloroflexia bacterium]